MDPPTPTVTHVRGGATVYPAGPVTNVMPSNDVLIADSTALDRGVAVDL